MDRKILYLFNSALRRLYRENLYSILALPIGAAIQFRYTTEHHVPPELLNRSLKGVDAIIVFVDRFSEGKYTYHPIRKGKILRTFEEGDRLFLICQLGEYCGVDIPEHFTGALKTAAKGVPELTDGNPQNTKDGYYIQFGEDVRDEVKTDADLWLTCVKGISQTNSFRDEHTAFLKISLMAKSRRERELFRRRDGLAILKTGKHYSLDILYYDPDKGEKDKAITFSLQEPLKCYGAEQFVLGALTERISIPFGAEKALRSARASITFTVDYRQSKIYQVWLPAEVSSRHLLWGTIFYAGVIGGLIALENFVPPSNTTLSLILEYLKWLAVIRIFIKLEHLPSLPIKP